MSITEHSKLSGLAHYLVTSGYIDNKKAHEAEKESRQKNIALITYLGTRNFITYSKLAEAIANYFGLPLFDLSSYDLNLLPKKILSPELIQQYFVLPLYKSNNLLLLAVSDPSLPNINEINFLTGLNTTLIIVEHDKLIKILDTIHSKQLQAGLQLEDTELEATIETASNEEKRDNSLSQIESDLSPVVKFLNKMLLDAINQNASDIHFEPNDSFYRIRYRLDGILHEVTRQPIKLANYLTARLKIMANLDISERRLPQDGRFKIILSKKRSIDFRLNTCPTLYGEKAVVRILASSAEFLDINALGMTKQQQQLFEKALSHSQGMILVTGPTGSGKTVTLYTALDKLNVSQVNISTIEDPVEIHLNGINQVQINLKAGLTFATSLRAFLRQDPDVIMVGEIRDLETAEIAVKAAHTGHLILSTLHTNSAPEALTRLSNMGVAPFNIASTIILIVAQRLIRRLCPHCKIEAKIPEATWLEQGFKPAKLNELTIYKPQGCSQCNQGYKGRTGIYEIMPVSKEMAKLILENNGSIGLAEQAKKENIPNLRQSGIEKVMEGITSLEEVNRVIRE